MSKIINERLQRYSITTREQEDQALREILQEIALYGLSESGFFKHALFQGGTSLRILYNLQRFSEDLDFILKEPTPDFKWLPFQKTVEEIFKEYGLFPEVVDKSKAGNIQKMILKDNSIVKLLNLSFLNSSTKFVIKLEVDTNPPLGSNVDLRFLDFPLPHEVQVQDLSSNFAGKSHALLCRKYIKGRDWYDFLWYVAKGTLPNLIFLENALNQQGVWEKQDIKISADWYLKALEQKVLEINWQAVANDVAPFLNQRDRNTLKLWSIPFFMDRIEKLKDNMAPFFLNPKDIETLIEYKSNMKFENEQKEKKAINDFLVKVYYDLIKFGYQVEVFKISRESLGDSIISIIVKNKTRPYQITIARAWLTDEKLQNLNNVQWMDFIKNLLTLGNVKIGEEREFAGF